MVTQWLHNKEHNHHINYYNVKESTIKSMTWRGGRVVKGSRL